MPPAPPKSFFSTSVCFLLVSAFALQPQRLLSSQTSQFFLNCSQLAGKGIGLVYGQTLAISQDASQDTEPTSDQLSSPLPVLIHIYHSYLNSIPIIMLLITLPPHLHHHTNPPNKTPKPDVRMARQRRPPPQDPRTRQIQIRDQPEGIGLV